MTDVAEEEEVTIYWFRLAPTQIPRFHQHALKKTIADSVVVSFARI